MIPQISQAPGVVQLVLNFLQALEQQGFTGDTATNYADRLTMATVHIARHINNDALVQRLTVGPGAAAARRKDQRGEALLRGQPGDKRDVGR